MVLTIAGVARDVGVSRLGVLASSMAVAAVVSGLFDFGANAYWVRELAAGRMGDDTYSARSGNKLLLGLVLAVVGGTLALVAFPDRAFWGVGPLLWSSLLSQSAQALAVAKGATRRLMYGCLLERGLLGAGFIALNLGSSVSPETCFYTAYTLGSVACALICFASVDRTLRPRLNLSEWPRTWAGSRYFGLSTAFVSLQGLDIIVAGAVGGSAVSGTYGAVNRWTAPIGLFTAAVATLQAPAFAAARDASDIWSRLRATLWLPAVAGCIAAFVALIADPLVAVLLGSQFAGASIVLQVLALAAAVSAATQTMMTVLQSRGFERFVAISLAWIVIVQLALVVPLVSLLGALGAAVSASVAQCLLFGSLAVGLVRVVGLARLKRVFRGQAEP